MIDSAEQLLLHTDREIFPYAVIASMYSIGMNKKFGRTRAVFLPEQN